MEDMAQEEYNAAQKSDKGVEEQSSSSFSYRKGKEKFKISKDSAKAIKMPFSSPLKSEIKISEEIRKEFADLLHDINWHIRRGGLLPYDWINYEHNHIIKLCELLKVDLGTGKIKKPDKRGHWR